MRVIAGEARRLKLIAPKGSDTRPTQDKIKETLFNILAPQIYGVNFLDLFAGSGAIGIEALSRGARRCTFIEKDRNALLAIRKNLETTHLSDKADVISSDVLSSLYNIVSNDKYDIVFMDPPYDLGIESKVLSILSDIDIIDEDTLIIIEAAADNDLSYVSGLGYEIIRIKEYKSNKHVFLRHIQQRDNMQIGGNV